MTYHGSVSCDNLHLALLKGLKIIVAEVDRAGADRHESRAVERVVVLGSQLGGKADRAGVMTGDTICEVNGVPVVSIAEVGNVLAAHDAAVPVRLLVCSNGIRRFIALPMDPDLGLECAS